MWTSSGEALGGSLGTEGLSQGTEDDSKLRRDESEEEEKEQKTWQPTWIWWTQGRGELVGMLGF